MFRTTGILDVSNPHHLQFPDQLEALYVSVQNHLNKQVWYLLSVTVVADDHIIISSLSLNEIQDYQPLPGSKLYRSGGY
jgi:hypothetical protein